MTAPDPVRRRELGAIHTAKKALALTDDCYRDLLQRLTGCRSARDLDAKQRSRVIEEFRRLGWGRGGRTLGPRASGVGGAATSAGDSKQVRKIRALWLSLWQLGIVDDPAETALERFATTLTHRDRMRWTDAGDLVWVTEALLDWCARHGYDARGPLRPWSPSAESWDSRLVEAQWRRLIALGVFEHGIHAGLDTWLRRTIPTNVAAAHFLPAHQQRRAVQLLGQWIRRVKAERAAAARAAADPGPRDPA